MTLMGLNVLNGIRFRPVAGLASMARVVKSGWKPVPRGAGFFTRSTHFGTMIERHSI